MTRVDALNVLGTSLVPCSYDPLTGWYRDGCCHTNEQDQGSHVICAKVTVEFLNFEMERGNNLIAARPEARFKGLKPLTDGASVRCVGAKPTSMARHLQSCWKAHTLGRSTSC